MFGYVDGAFTGARRGGKPGLFEMAHTGTIFLDEVLDISVPPLRKRPEDIIPLFISFMNQSAKKYAHGTYDHLPQKLADALLAYRWPGNIRELRNFAEKATVLFSFGDEREDTVNDLVRELMDDELEGEGINLDAPDPGKPLSRTLREIVAEAIRASWTSNNGNISETARVLGIDRATVLKHIS